MRDNNEKPPEGGPLLFAFATVFIVIVATRIDAWTADAIAIAFTCYATGPTPGLSSTGSQRLPDKCPSRSLRTGFLDNLQSNGCCTFN